MVTLLSPELLGVVPVVAALPSLEPASSAGVMMCCITQNSELLLFDICLGSRRLKEAYFVELRKVDVVLQFAVVVGEMQRLQIWVAFPCC